FKNYSTSIPKKTLVESSAKADHPTFALVRDSTLSTPSKSKILDRFKNLGVNLVPGDLYSHESLVSAIKQVDVVISAIGRTQLRFFPSEFGNDVDRVHAVELARTSFATKAKIRRAVEAEGIPYTYVASNFFAGLYLSSFSQPEATAPPRDKVVIVAFFNKEDDIGINSIKAVDDPRTLNKILYIRPRCSIYSFNDLVSLWEEKIGKALDRVYVTEEQLLKNIQEASYPLNMLLPIGHSAYVLGDQTNFEIEPSFGVEATELYPDANYTTRFFPSEFGNDIDRVHAVEPAKSLFAIKAKIRRAVEAEGIPYTYVASNLFAGYFLPNLSQPGATAPPRDKVVILGDGNPKAIYNEENDIGTYTIKAVDDPRTLNKILYIKPPGNIYSFNDLVSLWERKIGKTLERVYLPEEQVLKNIQEAAPAAPPVDVILSVQHSVFVKGDQTNFEIEPSFGVEASRLYPGVKYTTVDEYLNQFV
ncbi:hypothetical protein CUMW_135080, partial [Citrus unshiu]